MRLRYSLRISAAWGVRSTGMLQGSYVMSAGDGSRRCPVARPVNQSQTVGGEGLGIAESCVKCADCDTNNPQNVLTDPRGMRTQELILSGGAWIPLTRNDRY